MQLFWFSKFK